MASRVYTIHEVGMQGLQIEIECHSSNGLPGIIIVGLANKAVDEAKERLRSAFASSGLTFPRKRLTLNLAPADEPKESSSLDLAMAVSILLAHSTAVPPNPIKDAVLFGELSLDGSLRAVRGILGKILAARNQGFHKAVVPLDNLNQASLIDGIEVYGAKDLKEVAAWVFESTQLAKVGRETEDLIPEVQPYDSSFEEVIGHTLAKRAMEIAAAGGHNALMNGPPGTGKSMLAKAVPSILPPLTKQQVIETSHLNSLVHRSYEAVITNAPFRAPHHTASSVAIIGGGQHAKPGEISLAHNGVLLLDELPEFHRDCLEALRQPLEDGEVRIARAKQTIVYPADFMLIATKNPCPCGHYGTAKSCTCTAFEISRYNKKLSGPIMDRIDIHCEVEEVPYHLLNDKSHHEESSSIVRERIIKARQLQTARNPAGCLNAHLSNKHFTQNDLIDEGAIIFLSAAAEKLGISARSFVRTMRVARTIADLDLSVQIEKHHIAEALQFRPKVLQLI